MLDYKSNLSACFKQTKGQSQSCLDIANPTQDYDVMDQLTIGRPSPNAYYYRCGQHRWNFRNVP